MALAMKLLQVDRVARDQSRRGFEDVGIEVLHTVDIDVADVIEFLGASCRIMGAFSGNAGFDEAAVSAGFCSWANIFVQHNAKVTAA